MIRTWIPLGLGMATALLLVRGVSTQAPGGIVIGRVVDGTSRLPLAGASVFLGRAATRTNAEGAFRFSGACTGRCSLVGTKPGYFGGAYGQLTPHDSPIDLELQNGASAEPVELRLWSGGVITGHVRHDDGEPYVGATIRALRFLAGTARPTLASATSDRTDDRGEFRLTGLRPGRYVVALTSGPESFPTVFFPGSASVAGAAVIGLEAGEERSGADFNAPRLQGARVVGRLTKISGLRTPVAVQLVPHVPGGPQIALDTLRLSVDAGGGFVFTGVPPGQYLLRMYSFPPLTGGGQSRGTVYLSGPIPPAVSEEPTFWAETPIRVGMEDLIDVPLDVQLGARISGRVVWDGTGRPTAGQLMSAPLVVERVDGSDLGPMPLTRIEADGRFRTAGLPAGSYWCFPLSSRLPGWSLDSIRVRGQDATEGVEISSEDVTSVTLLMTDHPTEISGSVFDTLGRVRADTSVYVFPRERRFRTASWGVARVAQTTTVASGRYRVLGLVPGEYLVAVREGGAQADWRELDSLEALARTARAIHLSARSHQRVDLTLSPGR